MMVDKYLKYVMGANRCLRNVQNLTKKFAQNVLKLTM